MKKSLSISFILALLFSLSLFAQQSKIETFPVTPYMIAHGEIDTAVYKSEYTGLTTVGVGALVYVRSYDADGPFTWTLTSKPEGSATALDATDSRMVTFRPDMAGEYVVSLEVPGSDPLVDDLTFTAGTYLGVTEGGCSVCHGGTKDEWEETGHATILIRGLNGTLSGHYGEGCIKCHTTGYNADVEAVNGGFDDVADDLGWTFPETLEEGTYAAMDDDLKNVSNVQCESCHGPASAHAATFNPDAMAISLDSQMCGKCHDDGHYHRRPSQWANSAHNFDPFVSAHGAGARGYCGPCHSGRQFIEEVDPESGITFDAEDPAGVGCAVCHDPHSSHDSHDPMVTGDPDNIQQHHIRTLEDVTLENGFVVTSGGESKLCMNCHKSRRNSVEYVTEFHSHFGPHYNNQTDMIMGTNAITFGRYISNSTHKDAVENLCVSCHMAATPGTPEAGQDKIGDHSFSMSWDAGTPDDASDDIYSVAVCQDCHGTDKETFEDFTAREDFDGDGTTESTVDELHGLMEEVAMLLPPYGEATVEATEDFNAVELKAAYNYFFVEDDQSNGAHNYQYAVGILQVSKEALEYGVLTEGSILAVEDVPNDQGKQVFVEWTRFGGDGASDDPVTDYVVLRKDMADDMPATFDGLDAVPGDLSKVKIGNTVTDGHIKWTIAATTRAMQFFEYRIAVPTLYDSNPSDSTAATFKVVGVTASGLSAETTEMSGYSFDNLAPMTPSGIVGNFDDGLVVLGWEEAEEEDLQYYAIYRSENAGFDPAGMSPYATTAVNSFNDSEIEGSSSWYYKLAAFDFAGNQSEFSSEVGVVITGVEQDLGVPTEYTLSQNYPNPFNPSTTIKFGIPAQSHVTVTIYDVVGKVVGVLVDETLSAGYYNYTWNASNLASGIYFFELRSDKFSQTNKMLLMK